MEQVGPGNNDNEGWRSEAFRMSMVKKLEEAIQEHGLQGQKDPQQMENAIFQKARTRQDYLNCIARFILMIKSQRNAAAQQGINCHSIFAQHMHTMVQEVGCAWHLWPTSLTAVCAKCNCYCMTLICRTISWRTFPRQCDDCHQWWGWHG